MPRFFVQVPVCGVATIQVDAANATEAAKAGVARLALDEEFHFGCLGDYQDIEVDLANINVMTEQ